MSSKVYIARKIRVKKIIEIIFYKNCSSITKKIKKIQFKQINFK